MSIRLLIRQLIEYSFFRYILGTVVILRLFWFWSTRQKYRQFSEVCRLYRVVDIFPFREIAFHSIANIIRICNKEKRNLMVEWFQNSREYIRIRDDFGSGEGKKHDVMWNMLVVKSFKENEKGVIILKYGEVFEALFTIYNIPKIIERYYLVFEMSWSGSCDPCYLMYWDSTNSVFVQTPEQKDYFFLERLHCNIRPIKLGSGDWVDPTLFQPNATFQKPYDVAMVAHWGKLKNHRVLFKALRRIQREITLLLIGFPWGGRTKEDILNEYSELLGKKSNITLDLRENLAHADVMTLLIQAKMQILLTSKEGGNKAIPEGLFLNVPAIVYDRNKGGTREKINGQTGILSSFGNLHRNIEFMLENYGRFRPREYVLKTTGSAISTRILNDKIKCVSLETNGSWTCDILEKVNSPSLKLKDESCSDLFVKDYDFISKCKK